MRSIDADALKQALLKDMRLGLHDFAAAVDLVNAAPTVQAQPAEVPVCCTGCKYYGPGEHRGFWHCENWGVDVNEIKSPPDVFYCADGERKGSC